VWVFLLHHPRIATTRESRRLVFDQRQNIKKSTCFLFT
jgi:hypothetical protein